MICSISRIFSGSSWLYVSVPASDSSRGERIELPSSFAIASAAETAEISEAAETSTRSELSVLSFLLSPDSVLFPAASPEICLLAAFCLSFTITSVTALPV